MDLQKLRETLKDFPAFRFKQAQDLIFKNLIESWDQATNLPKEMKEALKENFPISIQAQMLRSEDKNSIKVALETEDKKIIETVLMKHKDGRNTVCVSSQVGCPLGCLFCATGKMKFQRNLKADEIITQVLFFARLLKKEDEKVSNIVFMGMGEPFLNYEEVISAIKILNEKDKFNIGSRKISVSSVGIVEGIRKLAKENLQINLAISLHAPNDKLRSEIIPINKKYPINKILQVCQYYLEKTGRRLMIEYVLIKNINDSSKHAEELSLLLKNNFSRLYFVNLIICNNVKGFQASGKKEIENFKKILKKNKVPFVERYRLGQEIEAACGQLAGKLKAPLRD